MAVFLTILQLKLISPVPFYNREDLIGSFDGGGIVQGLKMILTTKYRAALMAATALVVVGNAHTPAFAKKKKAPVTVVENPVVAAAPDLDAGLDSAPGQTGIPESGDSDVVITPMAGQIDPDWGNIRTFWGNIRTFEDGTTGEPVNPFWGNIRTFWGEVNPFEGDIGAFWGNIRTFNEGDPDSVTPEWGNIRTFWGEIGEKWGNIRTFWGNIRTFDDAEDLAGQLEDIIDQSEDFWGDAVEASTGQDFEEAFANPLLAKYGIDLDNPASLNNLDVAMQERFFMEWYDGLMNFSGADHVDHWMGQVNWNPALTVTMGEGLDSTIGLLDFTVTGDNHSKISFYDGISEFTNGHGAAVASLMIADHDGKGIMGLAPMANVVAYNPFDETATASWGDVRNGVLALAQNDASIINMSLGVSGWTLHYYWDEIFSDPEIAAATVNTVFVTAAGNDGITQTQDIDWNYAIDPALIVVGSVNPNGEISDFSNRPGDTCLLDDGSCGDGQRLMDRFIVAPGELILVADGEGGVTRRSGTSFAAPLVSGTVALIHDRWPWLSEHPKETVDIILQTAQDLGEAGTDGVYGVGQLDVTAALSPISFDNLDWYEYKNGKLKKRKSHQIRNSKERNIWENKGMYFYAFEDIGSTFRDFAIPLSTKLINQTILAEGGSQEQFQAYLYNAMMDWTNGGVGLTSPRQSANEQFAQEAGFRNFNSAATTAIMPNSMGLNMAVSVTPRRIVGGAGNRSFVPYQTAVSVVNPDGQMAFMVGEGDGAVQLGVASGMGQATDYDPYVGGVNPYLGFASGGAFGQFSFALSEKLRVSVGMSERAVDYLEDGAPIADRESLTELRPFESSATTVAVSYQLNKQIELAGSYTRLREENSLLGVQSLDRSDFGSGSTSDGVTLGASFAMGDNLTVSASGTVGRSHNDGGNIRAADGGLVSTAFQLAMDKSHVIDKHDHLRLSVSQPLHLETGTLELDILQVVDRRTGELGVVTERFGIQSSKRPVVTEFSYGRSLMNDTATLSLFGRARLQGDTPSADSAALLAGASFRMGF